MLIELQVNWTFATPPTTTPYPVDIYWRIVGDSNYTTVSITNGESGTANITILNSTTNTITDRELPCIMDVEGYVVPSCALNDPEERLPFTTATSLDLTDDMQCRGITAICKAGGIIGIIPDPDLSLVFNTDTITYPITIDTSSVVNGDPAKLPNILVSFTGSGPTSTIETIYCYDVDYSGGFDGTTTFDINGFNGAGAPITMTPLKIVTACGSIESVNNQCYDGNPSYIPFTSAENGDAIIKACTNNETATDYDEVFLGPETIGTVLPDTTYSCCQASECKVYNVSRNIIPEMPFMAAESVTLGYINAVTGQFSFFTMSPSTSSVQIIAIEDTIGPYGFDITVFPTPTLGEIAANLWATYFLLGGITVTAISNCSSFQI